MVFGYTVRKESMRWVRCDWNPTTYPFPAHMSPHGAISLSVPHSRLLFHSSDSCTFIGNGVRHCLLLTLPQCYPLHGSTLCQRSEYAQQDTLAAQMKVFIIRQLLKAKQRQYESIVRSKAMNSVKSICIQKP